ncbi:metallophosphoesterase [Ruicaihuangia caeni]|uniref:metallophosphoesterase n=1 Tax=Ruicaihuangia caeni TaxID=3042517 RepID=UPI003390271F
MTDEFTIVHLSDTHFKEGGALHHDVTDTVAALESVLGHLEPVRRVDLVACTGDLSDDGSVDSYRRLRAMVEPWAAERCAAVAYCLGNHDQTPGFRQAMTDAGLEPGEHPFYSSTVVDGMRVIVLDTHVPGAGYGAIGEEQLEWLRRELATPSERGTVLMLHHPPVPAETPLLRALELQHPEALIDVLRGSDVRVVLGGHYHAAIVDQVAGIPVVLAPAITNQSEQFSPPEFEGAVAGSGAAFVRVHEHGVRVLPFTVPRIGDGVRVYRFDTQQMQRIIEAAGPARHT